MKRFTYAGNEQENYSIMDSERLNEVILTAYMSEDCVIQLVHVLNQNHNLIITSE